MRECPECGMMLRANVTKCRCGWSEESDAKKAREPNLACSWFGGPPCPMKATWFERGGDKPGLCSWHAETKVSPRLDNYEEFERWVYWHVKQRYCTGWSHFPAQRLWDALHDARKTLGEPQPCLASKCHHRPFDELMSWTRPETPLLPPELIDAPWSVHAGLREVVRQILPLPPEARL